MNLPHKQEYSTKEEALWGSFVSLEHESKDFVEHKHYGNIAMKMVLWDNTWENQHQTQSPKIALGTTKAPNNVLKTSAPL